MPTTPAINDPSLANGRYAFGLTIADVEELREIMRSESGVELTLDEAWARAIELLSLFRMLMGPLPESRVLGEFEHSRP